MVLVLALFVIIDFIVWITWKNLARPIISLTSSVVADRKSRHYFFVPWSDIEKVTNVTIPNGQTTLPCLFIFAKNPENYIKTATNLSAKRVKLNRWLRGVQPEYFQNDFPGTVLAISITQLGIYSQKFLDLVTTVWKQNNTTD